jgi:hypothetical protein
MELIEYLKKLDEKYYTEQEESNEFAIKELKKVYKSVLNDEELLNDFMEEAPYICGGAFIPFLFWITLAKFTDNPENIRPQITELIKAFCKSDFNEIDAQELKPLIITYFAMEKRFEIDKLKTYVIDKSHPEIINYFNKLLTFVDKNKDSVKTYIEKFNLLKNHNPDFELLNLPIVRLKETLKHQ